MTISLNYNDSTFTVETISWDRDSYFIEFNTYWNRFIGAYAQKIAENTTNNWNTFNLVRTRTIVLLGINPDSQEADPSSPVKILPVSTYPSILASSLKDLILEKSREDLNILFQELLSKASNECANFIKEAILEKNCSVVKKINNDAKQILITNDSEENNNIFLRESGLKDLFFKSYCQINKEQIFNLPENNNLLITNNSFLARYYTKKGIKNILLADDLSKLSFKQVSSNNRITVNIDGASKGNPGEASIGIVFYKENKPPEEYSEFIGIHTNNFAEYTALIRALEIALNKGYKNIQVKSDSELIVKQIKKLYKIKDADMKDLFDKAYSLIEKFSLFDICHIPREENLKADKLANKALKNNPG